VAIGVGARPPKVLAFLSRTLESSTQLPVRLALLVVGGFMVVSMELGFEDILGAFAAGMVVGLATRGEGGKAFRVKIDAVCFGWFTPFFFVVMGAQFDVGVLTHFKTMLLVPAFLVMLLLVRGPPVFLYRNDMPKPEWVSFAFSASIASLSLVIVITQIGLRAKRMNPDIAHALVGAALLFLLATLVISALVMAAIESAEGRAALQRTRRVLEVYGRVPFFYFLLHIALVHLLALMITRRNRRILAMVAHRFPKGRRLDGPSAWIRLRPGRHLVHLDLHGRSAIPHANGMQASRIEVGTRCCRICE
jgi:Sodium/hydrogen exchanger family